MIWNLRCNVTIDSVLANTKTQNAFVFTVNTIFRHDYPLAVEPASTPRPLAQKKKTWRDSLSIDMLLSAVSVLVVAQSSSEIQEGHMNNPIYIYIYMCVCVCVRACVCVCVWVGGTWVTDSTIRAPSSYHWQLRICTTVTTMFVLRHRRNHFQLSAVKRWQLASRRRPLRISCQSGTF